MVCETNIVDILGRILEHEVATFHGPTLTHAHVGLATIGLICGLAYRAGTKQDFGVILLFFANGACYS
jgi:hypothetical protein